MENSRTRSIVAMIAAVALASSLAHAASLDVPSNGDTLSGIGIIHGWKCKAEGAITIRFDNEGPIPATYGFPRGDTSTPCGGDDGNNGFYTFFNWAILGDGEHTAVAYDAGVEFARSTFTVTTTGEEFLTGASAQVTVEDFPAPGESTTFVWNESTQHLEMVRIEQHPKPYQMNLRIIIEPGGWGVARLNDITRLLEDVASHLDRLLRTPFTGVIRVRQAPDHARTPRIFYRSSPEEPFVIQLTAQNRRWSQYSFQFAHEFCHALTNYEEIGANPNNWFREAISELASVFTLRRMAERWPHSPPYPNWASYAGSLASYTEERISRPEVQLPANVTLSEWLSSHEEILRQDPYLRDYNSLVAYILLPIFESDPTGWNAIRRFPTSRGSLADYLSDWYSLAEIPDKSFVRRIAAAFDIQLGAP